MLTEAATRLRRSGALLALIGSLLGLAPAPVAADAPPAPPTESPNAVREIRVLLMYAEDRLAPAFVAQVEAFRNTLQSNWPGPVARHRISGIPVAPARRGKLMLELLERK